MIFSPTEREVRRTAFESEKIATGASFGFEAVAEGVAVGGDEASALFEADGSALGLALGLAVGFFKTFFFFIFVAAIADEPVTQVRAIPITAMIFRRERFSIFQVCRRVD